MQTKKIKNHVNGQAGTHAAKACATILAMAFAICAAIFVSPPQAAAQNAWTREHEAARSMVSAPVLLAQIGFLSDSLCQGRATGTRGNAEAAFWIQRHFAQAGLLKFGDSYARRIYAGNGTFGRNIIGMLPGSTHFSRDRYVIVGAHFDHLGILNGKMYPGADANASGTVAMINLAKMLSAMRKIGKTHDSNIIFVAFDGKEVDMVGSKAFWRMIENGQLKDPQTGAVITRRQISLMVNIDQIGSTLSPLRPDRKDFMIMLGTHSLKPVKRELLQACNRMFAIDLDISLTYYGSENFTNMFYRLSDQRVFVDNGIPAVLFTSGITMNTNKTRDTPQTLDAEIMRKRILLMYHWIEKML